MVIERTVLESVDLIDAILTSHTDSSMAMKAIRHLCYMLDVFGFDGLLKGGVKGRDNINVKTVASRIDPYAYQLSIGGSNVKYVRQRHRIFKLRKSCYIRPTAKRVEAKLV